MSLVDYSEKVIQNHIKKSNRKQINFFWVKYLFYRWRYYSYIKKYDRKKKTKIVGLFIAIGIIIIMKEINYEEQKEEMYKEFKKLQDKFKDDPKNPFKELIITKFKKREEDKIKDIFDKCGIDEDVYCPFIIFLFDKENKEGNSLETPNEEEKLENIFPDQEEYNISPLKVFTFFFDRYESESTKELFERLIRIYSIL